MYCEKSKCRNPIYELVYKFIIRNNITNDLKIYVNAQNGEILNFENLACSHHPLDIGTANTKYSGLQSIKTSLSQFSGEYLLRGYTLNTTGVEFKTLNASGSFDEITALSTATDFTDNDNNWTTTELGQNNIATDVHWGVEKTLNYWLTKHNRNSYDALGATVTSYVHYAPAFNNALWSLDNHSIFFGDGNINLSPAPFTALTTLDMIAHEFGHGVTQSTSNLSVINGSESWALNEGFSDIWGACVEAYESPNKQRWLIGEEFVQESPFYLRSLKNPPNAWSIPVSDTYNDVNWNNYTTGHVRSGVLSKWFYLMSEGGNGTNGIGNNYNVYGITLEKSEKIAYNTLLNLQSNASYAMARILSIQYTQQQYGTNSCEVKAVTDAWYAVGVGAAYSGTVPFTSTFSISGTYTNNGTSATIAYKVNPNLQFAYKWYVNGILQPSNTNTCVTTSVMYDCNSSTSPQWIDNNIVSVVICGNTFTCNPIVSICGNAPDPSIKGKINCGFNTAIIPPPCCVADKTNSLINSSDNFNIFPNPSSGEFIVKSQDFKKAVKKVIIKNKMGIIVYEKVITNYQNQQIINLSGNHADIYFVEIFDGDSWTNKKLSLQY